MRVIVTTRKWFRVWFLAQVSQSRNERILECRFIDPDFVEWNPGFMEFFLDDLLRFVWFSSQ
jgi:hypothetical protein